VEVADSTSTSAFLSRSVDSACAASAVEVVACGWDFLGRNDLVVSFLPGILLDSFWELLGGLSGLLGDVLGFADLGFFRLLSLLMGCVKETVLFFGGFCSVPVALVNCSS